MKVSKFLMLSMIAGMSLSSLMAKVPGRNAVLPKRAAVQTYTIKYPSNFTPTGYQLPLDSNQLTGTMSAEIQIDQTMLSKYSATQSILSIKLPTNTSFIYLSLNDQNNNGTGLMINFTPSVYTYTLSVASPSASQKVQSLNAQIASLNTQINSLTNELESLTYLTVTPNTTA